MHEGYNGVQADYFALGSLLFTMMFGMLPFRAAHKDDQHFRYILRGGNFKKFFFKVHPATKELYNKGEMDPDLSEVLLALLESEPNDRPKSISEIRQFRLFA